MSISSWSLPGLPPLPDDGACDHLAGRMLPALQLHAHDGTMLDLAGLRGLTILFVHTLIGRPDRPNPPDWDQLPGAHGSTPQALGYRTLHETFQREGIAIFGISAQDSDAQLEAATRLDLPFRLLSDTDGAFGNALALPRFTSAGKSLTQRATLILRDTLILTVLYPVPDPAEDAGTALSRLRSHRL
ncbi:Thioredoxin peroxidase family protein [Granulibacter bethesdensis]|uniref:Thioredoxin peroxidase family protein n=1 Tax=Granulibacter bethesdensis TaxID=364410 RepID=A0AAN0RCZ3_9PROT|nr:redoxin domain-containing protein [Granulibacter bethesdensis]AHJ62630.1 Thioredoxin peroxidase family protein [Granulibacter bethesdensis]